jgi:hypothetical protein
MSHLEVGDVVLAAPNTYSTVYLFTHRLTDFNTTFVNITTDSGSLSLSLDHFLYVNGVLVVAAKVVVGDVLTTGTGDSVYVKSVSNVWTTGVLLIYICIDLFIYCMQSCLVFCI